MDRADRKRQLIAEGRVYRAEVMLSKEAVREGLRPDSMARRVLGQVAAAGLAALRAKSGFGLPGANVATLLPLVVKGVSSLARHRSLVKPALRGAAIAGSIAAVAAFFFRRRKRSADESAAAESEPDA